MKYRVATIVILILLEIVDPGPAAGIGPHIGLKDRDAELRRQKDKKQNKWIRLQNVRDKTTLLYKEEKDSSLKPGVCAQPDLHGENNFRTAYVFTRMRDNSGSHKFDSSIHDIRIENAPVKDGIRGKHGFQEQIFFNYQRSAYYQLAGMRNGKYILGFEGADPPTTGLSQEGNSFCIVGPHYFNSPDLKNHRRFKPFAKLGTFDIGTHTYPNDYSRMNVHDPRASDTDIDDVDTVEENKYICNKIVQSDVDEAPSLKLPFELLSLYPWKGQKESGTLPPQPGFRVPYSPREDKYAETTTEQDFDDDMRKKYKVEFEWEGTDADGVFFHTRRTRYPNSQGIKNSGNGTCDEDHARKAKGKVEVEFWPRGYEPNPRYPYILDYVDEPPHPAARIRQMITPYPDATNKSQYGFMFRPAYHDDQPDSRCKNPYFIEVTEIEVNGVRLRNWLHITVYVRREFINRDPNRKNCPTGKMKYIMLEVRDQQGLPVGDFDNDLPCERSGTCGCKSKDCIPVHGKKRHAMPCMFTPERAVRQPGIFMHGVENPDSLDYFDEVHVSWKFAQHTASFTSELHFASLILESNKKLRYYNGRQTFYENPLACKKTEMPCRFDAVDPVSDDAYDRCSCKWIEHCENYFKGQGECSTKEKRNHRIMWLWNENYQFQTFQRSPQAYVDVDPPHYLELSHGGHFAVLEAETCKRFVGNLGEGKVYKKATQSHASSHIDDDHSEYHCTKNQDIKSPSPNCLKYNPDWHNFYITKPGCSHCVHYLYEPKFRSKNKQKGYYSFSLQHIVPNSDRYKRPYGFNAQYRLVRPTYRTLGGPDPFMLTKYVDITSINCHKRVDTEFYKSSSKPNGKIPVRKNFYEFKRSYELDGPKKTCGRVEFSSWECSEIVDMESALKFASTDTSDFQTTYTQVPLTIDIKNPRGDYAGTIQMGKVYFGTYGTKEAYLPYTKLPKPVLDYMSNLPSMEDISYEERCACPAYGTTLAPENVTKDVSELQGRSAHASQMLFAWIFLIPVAIFVARYYKETYSKVFIFREFWWYTVHFGCLWTALLFMIGGVLAIEYKREVDFLEAFARMDDAARVHLILGSISMIIFVAELIHNYFRPKKLHLRVLHSMAHWAFGFTLYVLGAIAVMFSAWIPQSRMGCNAVYTYIGFLVFQVVMYTIMEIHQQHVDRLLALYPPRTYFPVMIVRLFHTNAPLAHFRILMLIIYIVVCLCVYFFMRYGEIEANVRACYKNQGLDYDADAYF